MTLEDDLVNALQERAERDAPEVPSLAAIRRSGAVPTGQRLDPSRRRRVVAGAIAASFLAAAGAGLVVARSGDGTESTVTAGPGSSSPIAVPEEALSPPGTIGPEELNRCPVLAAFDDRVEKSEADERRLAEIDESLPMAGPDERRGLELERSNLLDEPMAVGGEQGATGGFVIPSHLDEMLRRVAVRMCADGHVEQGGFPPRDAPPGLVDAYTLVEAAEVRTESGELIGYWANHFVPLAEYEVLLPDAEALISSSRKPR